MGKKDPEGGSDAAQMMRLFLKVNGDECPQLVMQPDGKGSYPANLVPLSGCSVMAKHEYDEEDAWAACSRVANACHEGHLLSAHRFQVHRNLVDACSVLNDLMFLMGDELEPGDVVGRPSIQALLSKAKDLVLSAGRGLDMEIDSQEPRDEDGRPLA